MNTAIVVDAACDLPIEFFQNDSIRLLPIAVAFGDNRFFDTRDAETTREFYDDYSHFRARDVFSAPPSVKTVKSLITEEVAGNFDQALVMCISAQRSELYRFASEGARQAMKELGRSDLQGVRLRNLRVMDTRTVFSGQALLAYEAIQIINLVDDVSNKSLYDMLRVLSVNVEVYTIPDDLYYIRARASLRGERTVGGWTHAVGKSLDIKPVIKMQNGQTERIMWGRGFLDAVRKLFARVSRAIEDGLMINAVMISFAGNTRDIMMLKEFRQLSEYADQNGIKVYLTIMSMSAGINVGPGAMSVAYCP